MCRQKRAIYLVAWFTQQMNQSNEKNTHEFNSLKVEWNGQLRNLGLISVIIPEPLGEIFHPLFKPGIRFVTGIFDQIGDIRIGGDHIAIL